MKANAIVIIDDDDDDRFLMAEALRISGATQKIIELSCGNDFIALINKWHGAPDLILMDVEMPAMTGLELMDSLRDHAGLTHTPKIMLSTNPVYEQKAKHAGADDFYVKPLTLDEYLVLAKNLLRRYLP